MMNKTCSSPGRKGNQSKVRYLNHQPFPKANVSPQDGLIFKVSRKYGLEIPFKVVLQLHKQNVLLNNSFKLSGFFFFPK